MKGHFWENRYPFFGFKKKGSKRESENNTQTDFIKNELYRMHSNKNDADCEKVKKFL